MSAKGRQVRLDDDVAAALAPYATRSERSLSAEANHQLRKVLGLTTNRVGGAPAAASAAAPRSRCMHPVNLRIAGRCMAPGCGAMVPTGRR